VLSGIIGAYEHSTATTARTTTKASSNLRLLLDMIEFAFIISRHDRIEVMIENEVSHILLALSFIVFGAPIIFGGNIIIADMRFSYRQ
jgi:hypothetical protein